jgi:hypothetical protein
MRLERHAARIEKMINAYKILVGHLEGRDQLRELGVDWVYLA